MGVFEETNNYLLIKEKVKIQNYSKTQINFLDIVIKNILKNLLGDF